MSRQEHLEKIRKACVAANPEIIAARSCDCAFCDSTDDHLIFGRQIGLADVLLAMRGKATDSEQFWLIEDRDNEHWNLRTDLEGQSDETLAFIASLV